MVALRYILGIETELDVFKCRYCDKQYHIKNGIAALRRHFECKHDKILQKILAQFGMDKTPGLELQNEYKHDHV
ncbi:hypothetical protein B9Z55_021650 [Caenorhabditis nigoni]|uniref:BED-type domain-containing protein n=1 Tax=Caenorhabditis nigoni TaxID=1611254 RepID=A0A2G5TSW5_9PELO|nr:hypothetical protein B9Z55_021650 [Caenorhabditis nigoni]